MNVEDALKVAAANGIEMIMIEMITM